MVATLSGVADLGGIVAVVAFAVLARLLGRWLIRKGSSLESTRHGPLPGGYMDPRPRAREAGDEPRAETPPDRHDPFNSG